MDKSIQSYILESKQAGVSEDAIKQKLVEAGWVSSEVDAILVAINAEQTHATTAAPSVGPKQHFSLRKIPEFFMDVIWSKIL